MSYILDALRKSEDQRRLGQTPDLSSAPANPARSNRRATVRRAALIASAVVVIAGAGFWWFGHREIGMESDQLIADQAPAASPTNSGVRQASAGPDPNEQALVSGRNASGEPTQDEAPEQRRRRTVVDRRSPDQQPLTAVSRPAPARPGAVSTPPPVVPDGERERLVVDADEAMQIVEAREPAGSTQPANDSQSQASASRPQRIADPISESDDATSSPAEWEPERTEFIEVWDLPLAIRRELPELAVSIHVFSTSPKERFVLINGERRLEGAALGSGARLVEVAREGAIVEFRDYRFLLRP